MQQPAFASSLFDCDDATSLRLATGARFIRKLPDDRSLGYLHKLFSPITSVDQEKLQSTLGRRLPAQYQEFLQWANGASLFDNGIYLLGFSENLSRSTEIGDQAAISITWENEVFSATKPERWEGGWTKVGSAVGWDSTFDLQLHQDGSCAFVGAHGAHVSPSFDECLGRLISRVGTCFSCDGVIDKSYAEVESALASLIQGQ